MSRTPLAVTLLAGAVLALAVLGPASARTPAKYGGTLVVAMSVGEPSTLDPTLSGASTPTVIYHAMCQQLYDYNAKQQLVPLLAAAVQPNRDRSLQHEPHRSASLCERPPDRRERAVQVARLSPVLSNYLLASSS